VVDREVVDTDPEEFDCASCELARKQDELWAENIDAWQVFQDLARRFVVDVGIGALVLERHLADRGIADALDLVDRLALIYDVVCPRPADGD
jgi:hypothetical protein